MSGEILLSVRTLVGFLLKSGSIDNRFGGTDRMLEGSRIHRMLQKKEGPGYQPEVILSLRSEHGGTVYQVQGRADGVITRPEGVTIDEIKTTGYPMELITEDFDRAHWGQAMCYGHFLCVKQKLSAVDLRLTYYQIETDEIKRFVRSYTAEELRLFYEDLLDQYEVWAEFQSDWKLLRDQTIRALPFPFESYRGGQRQLAVAVYRTVERGGRLFCQAPTGIGKTVSTLFPSIKSMAEGICEKLFYLTAKTITRQTAEEAFGRMRGLGLRMKTVTLTAKDKVCFLEERECNPEKCPYADGYFDRVNDALYQCLQENDVFTRQTIESCARKYNLCPFEFALDLTIWCDAIVCDYNYLFDPVVYLKRLLSDEGGNFVFLIDEAHNLVERSRDMYSASLSKSAILSLKRKCEKEKPLNSMLGRLNSAFVELRKKCGEEDELVEKTLPEGLADALMRFTSECDAWMQEHKTHPFHSDMLNLYFEVLFFLRIVELYDEHYVTFYSDARKGLQLELLCLDTSAFLDNCMKRGKAAILFSATFSPLEYFLDVLGGGEGAHTCRLPSPFEPEHLRLLVADRISTKYLVRDSSYRPIADMLFTMVSGRTGNYLVYFPSYRYLDEVYQVFREQYPQIDTLVQSVGMDELSREEFLAQFDERCEKSLLGFCVLGGIYSEGIDLQGDRLIGTAVVGVGLPQFSTKLNVLRDYFNEKSGQGYDFSYRYPGMNKVLQAAGRVIRGNNDRGVVLLIDSRFTSGDYLSLFPVHWCGYRTIRNAGELASELRSFWSMPE